MKEIFALNGRLSKGLIPHEHMSVFLPQTALKQTLKVIETSEEVSIFQINGGPSICYTVVLFKIFLSMHLIFSLFYLSYFH